MWSNPKTETKTVKDLHMDRVLDIVKELRLVRGINENDINILSGLHLHIHASENAECRVYFTDSEWRNDVNKRFRNSVEAILTTYPANQEVRDLLSSLEDVKKQYMYDYVRVTQPTSSESTLRFR